MIPHRLVEQLEPILTRINTAVSLLDIQGNSLIPDADIRFTLPGTLEPGQIMRWEGRCFCACTKVPELVLMTPLPDSPHVRDALMLCDEIVTAHLNKGWDTDDLSSAYQRILESEMAPDEVEAIAEEHHIPQSMTRRVLMLNMPRLRRGTCFDLLEPILSMAGNDYLVPMGKHSAALIKDAREMTDVEEVREYASALQETVLGETGQTMNVGIGETWDDPRGLYFSCRQARRAIDIGCLFHAGEGVFVYSAMLFERFLADLEPEKAEHYYSLLFNPSTARLFSEEMLETIDMFFRKDLNLSDTSRQLYIHRNTLVYRLDKVQRQVGLDLRKFEDAVTFKLLYAMRRCCEQRARKQSI